MEPLKAETAHITSRSRDGLTTIWGLTIANKQVIESASLRLVLQRAREILGRVVISVFDQDRMAFVSELVVDEYW